MFSKLTLPSISIPGYNFCKNYILPTTTKMIEIPFKAAGTLVTQTGKAVSLIGKAIEIPGKAVKQTGRAIRSAGEGIKYAGDHPIFTIAGMAISAAAYYFVPGVQTATSLINATVSQLTTGGTYLANQTAPYLNQYFA